MPNTLHELIGTAGWSLVAIVCVAVALGVGGVYRGPRVVAFWAWVKRRWAADYDVKHWLMQGIIIFNQLIGWLLRPLSKSVWADETMSSAAYRAGRDGKPFGFWRVVIDLLFFWQKQPEGVNGHCHGAYLNERARRQLPPEMRSDSKSIAP